MATLPFKSTTNFRQFLHKSSSTSSIGSSCNHSTNCHRCDNIIEIKRDNYRIGRESASQLKTIKALEERIKALKSENEKIKSQHKAQTETLKKLKAKFLYIPGGQVLSKQCIELKNKVDLYKERYNALRTSYIKSQKRNKSLKHQLSTTR
eukprot:812104_1